MNRRINKCVETYIKKLKSDISDTAQQTDDINTILHQLYNYPLLILAPNDYQKRQRAKNLVPLYERCTAYRANKEQCTRRRRANEKFCGTHAKGTPHGIVNIGEEENPVQKVEVWLQEINGINYYIDDNNNVYDPQDVYQNKINPRRIHTYKIDNDENYTLN